MTDRDRKIKQLEDANNAAFWQLNRRQMTDAERARFRANIERMVDEMEEKTDAR